jgi:hypothetical protein
MREYIVAAARAPRGEPANNQFDLLEKQFHKRANWMFAGSLRAGQRAAAIMSLVRSAQLNGHDPYAYLKDVLTRLPTQRADQIGELLPHHWVPAIA